ncbi:hypothetical protein [Litorimonas sp.]|uniref:hypothetical protein n=1 Tax=Litorimonas sp. TaxID=1892381 RepID=UPI003A8492F8
MNPYIILGGLVGSLLMAATASLFSYNQGKKVERLKWETANVDTLKDANLSLSSYLAIQAQEAAEAQERDIQTGNTIDRAETRIIERIREVPVEKVIRIGSDCRVDYGIVRLRNDWAKGDSLGSSDRNAEGGNIPLDGSQALPRNLIRNQPK